MAVDDLDFADVDQLIEALAAVEVKAHLDHRDVRPPAVWIDFRGPGSDSDVLGGGVVRLVLYPVVAGNIKLRYELDALAALWNKVRPVVQAFGGPSGDVTPIALVLGTSGSDGGLPAFRVPLDLFTEGAPS